MPLYEYRCTACDHRFEKIQSFNAPDEKECPVCHGEVERLISAPAVQFKGSGFYSTDYVSKPSAAKADASAAGDGSKASSDGGKAPSSSLPGDGTARSSSGSEAPSSNSSTAASSSAPAPSAGTTSTTSKS